MASHSDTLAGHISIYSPECNGPPSEAMELNAQQPCAGPSVCEDIGEMVCRVHSQEYRPHT